MFEPKRFMNRLLDKCLAKREIGIEHDSAVTHKNVLSD